MQSMLKGKLTKEQESMLNKNFIAPLNALSFELEMATYLEDDNETLGTYILWLEADKEFTEEEMKMIDNICTQDDDGQPAAMYTFYAGTLIITIPVLF